MRSKAPHILVVIGEKASARIIVSLVAIASKAVLGVRSARAQDAVVKPGSTIRFRLGADDPYRVARLKRGRSYSSLARR